jgi:hypothetical protein
MSSVSQERDLRKAVVRLHALPSNDFDAVIASLEAPERAHILTLLSKFNGVHSEAPFAGEPFAEVVVPPDLSPWLVARVNGQGDFGEETADPFVITSHAQMIVRQCAATMMPQPGASKRKLSLFDRLRQVFV